MTSSSTTINDESSSSSITVAAVEGGGTTFVVAVAKIIISSSTTKDTNNDSSSVQIVARTEIDSSHDNPKLTLEECCKFIKEHIPKDTGYYDALGIACFGPLGVNVNDGETYGCILPTTPKSQWRNFNLLKPLKKVCEGEGRKNKLPILIDTDVNAPALAEYLKIRQQNDNHNNNISSLAYVTCGTGVGVGLIINGRCVHGRMHPEGGHVPVQPLPDDDFPGYSWGKTSSPFGGIHTVEGIASSVALTERLNWNNLQNKKEKEDSTSKDTTNTSTTTTTTTAGEDRNVLSTLSDDHDVWDHASNALANLCVTLLLTTSIERIVLGGGIMKRNGLLDKVRTRTRTLLNGYLELPNDMSDLITTSYYGTEVGLMGAIMLAQQAYCNTSEGNDNNNETKEGNSNDHNEFKDSKKNNTETSSFNEGIRYGVLLGAVVTLCVMKIVSQTNRR